MILSRTPLTMAEALSFAPAQEEKRPVDDYFKTFVKLSKEDALKLAKEIRALNNPKINEEGVVKLVDFLPKDSEDANKILLEANLNEEEANAILEIVKKY